MTWSALGAIVFWVVVVSLTVGFTAAWLWPIEKPRRSRPPHRPVPKLTVVEHKRKAWSGK